VAIHSATSVTQINQQSTQPLRSQEDYAATQPIPQPAHKFLTLHGLALVTTPTLFWLSLFAHSLRRTVAICQTLPLIKKVTSKHLPSQTSPMSTSASSKSRQTAVLQKSTSVTLITSIFNMFSTSQAKRIKANKETSPQRI
jgi:hypothetical protein